MSERDTKLKKETYIEWEGTHYLGRVSGGGEGTVSAEINGIN